MVEHFSNSIQLVLVMSVSGMLVVAFFIMFTNCSGFDPAQVLTVDDWQFPV